MGANMKTERNILIAFLLNLAFSVFEFIGGIITGSVAIVSDAVHDLGDAISIGISYFLERKSRRPADAKYTYGYGRYSVIGGIITTLVLLLSSCVVIYNAVHRIANPIAIHYDGMILFAIFGVCVNACAAFFTRDGHSINQKAVNLHMLEDVLGWVVVLLGAIVMRYTDFALLDPILSIGVAAFIIVGALKNLQEAGDLFLEKAPHGIDPAELRAHIAEIDGVTDVHHMHVRSFDGMHNAASMHLVIEGDHASVKACVRALLREHGIAHITLETENVGEECADPQCNIKERSSVGHHHCHHKH